MKTLGLDIGTTSISSVIFREKTGVLEAKTIANGTFLSSESWERLQNPAAIWQKAFRVVSELLQRHPDVRAIGVTGADAQLYERDGAGVVWDVPQLSGCRGYRSEKNHRLRKRPAEKCPSLPRV